MVSNEASLAQLLIYSKRARIVPDDIRREDRRPSLIDFEMCAMSSTVLVKHSSWSESRKMQSIMIVF